MTVTLNGRATQLAGGVTVADLVARQVGDARRPGVAVALNGRVLPRHDWPDTRLSDGDAVEVLTASQGG
ncbi:MAG: sulfur carrier protein ThiS [Actinomycetota bacterium]|nr:sulfur carrier protein ThiS [Actinomycetota bacterium]